jgi:secreted PhoX family phosphatase
VSAYGDESENIGTNPSTETHFEAIVERRLSRRGVLIGGLATTAAFLGAAALGKAPVAQALPGKGNGNLPAGTGAGLLGFTAIPPGTGDDVAVPAGYSATPFLPWGTPILGTFPAFRPGANSAVDQEQQIGMHHDGMHFFPYGSGRSADTRGLLAINHEYTDEKLLHTGTEDSTAPRPTRVAITLEQVRKSQAAHGVSIVEVERAESGAWTLRSSSKNRRITANTPMEFAGPATGHRLLRTSADPQGTSPVGTFNNCANGATPWGTYLTCEENFNGYFAVRAGTVGDDYDAETKALNSRYGVGGDSYYWAERDSRFVITPKEPHEVNRFGWVVEIDPHDPTSTPVKRTALGRLKHEGAFVHLSKGQRVVVYMGDDQVNEYAYKFVSAGNHRSLMAQGKSPLDEGTLYVAQFSDDGRGRWLPLVHGEPGLTAAEGFADQGDVLVKARLAATSVGATPMHRPEWTSVDQNTGAVYLTLSNDGGSTSAVRNAANPRTPNPWGSVIRWYEDGDDHAATSFTWDLLLLAGPGRDSAQPDGSTIDADDAFGSPDGVWVDRDSRVWIQTDGPQPGGANDQMLAANPFVTDADGRPELKRFFTGVNGCEVTGIIDTPDQRTMFVNIQHPGDGAVTSTWPRMEGFTVPRSATVVITKDDGGVIGS